MKVFVSVTDNDWFTEVTLLKPDWPKAQGLRLTAFRSHWAKRNNVSLGAGPPERRPVEGDGSK